MKRIFLCLLLVFAWPIDLWAQAVKVRSGEHDSFTRLVFQLPEKSTWNITSAEKKLSIQFAGAKVALDVSSVFSRIGRDRLSALNWSQDDSTLELLLVCDCSHRSFRASKNALVLDIIEPERPSETATATARVPAPFEKALNKTVLSFGIDRTVQKSEPIHPAPTALPIKGFSTQATARPSEKRQTAEIEKSISAAQGVIIGRLAKGSTEGILSPTQRAPKVSNRSSDDTSQEVTSDRHTTQIQLAPNFIECQEDFDFQQWGNETHFSEQLAELRSNLINEIGAVDIVAAEKLTKFFLFNGFGAEAAEMIQLEPKIDPSGLLLEFAWAVDGDFQKLTQKFSENRDCGVNYELIAALSGEQNAISDPNRLTQAVYKLPQELRVVIGTAIAEKLAEFGHTRDAEDILRTAVRGDRIENAGALMAKARIQQATGEVEEAKQNLETVIARNNSKSADALLQHLDMTLKNNEVVEESHAELSSALAFEMRKTEKGYELQEKSVLALATASRFSEAFSELQKLGPSIDPDTRSKLYKNIMNQVRQNASDEEFLLYALQPKELHAHPEIDLLIAERMLGLGFPGEARKYIPLSEGSPVGDSHRILSAKISLALQQPRRALAELIGVEGEQADLIRAQVFEETGQYAEAARLYQDLKKQEKSEFQSWLAGEWSSVARSKDPKRAQIAKRILATRIPNKPDSIEEESLSLENEISLLQESDSTRREIEALLAAVGN